MTTETGSALLLKRYRNENKRLKKSERHVYRSGYQAGHRAGSNGLRVIDTTEDVKSLFLSMTEKLNKKDDVIRALTRRLVGV